MGNTRAERADVLRLVTTGKSQLVVFAVYRNVFRVPFREFLDCCVNIFHAARLAHLLGAVVGVATRTVPIALEGLGVEGDLDTPLLRNADEEVAGHPEVVTH
jgi:hypothetical protein